MAMSAQLPAVRLPDLCYSSDGQEFDAALDLWRFRTPVRQCRVDLGEVHSHATADFAARYRRSQKAMFCTQNVDSAWITHRRLVNLLHDLPDDRRPIDMIEADDAAAFLSGVNIGYAAHLRMIGRKARAIRSPIFSADGLDFLDRVFVPDTNDQSAVLRWDPVAGPYRPSEDKALKAAIDAAFNDGRMALHDYALIRCFRGFGPRPAQLAAMKVGDIRREADRVLIRIPNDQAARRAAPRRLHALEARHAEARRSARSPHRPQRGATSCPGSRPTAGTAFPTRQGWVARSGEH